MRRIFIAVALAVVAGCGFEEPSPADAPRISFVTDGTITDETIGMTEVEIELTKVWHEPVRVTFKVTGGTATVDNDFHLTTGQIEIPPGELKATLVITIAPDGIEEEQENATITLSDPEQAHLGDISVFDLRIAANKLPRIKFSQLMSMAGEGTGAQMFAIELDVTSIEDVVVRYTWDGTSEDGDHGLVDGMLTILPGQRTTMLPVPITNDTTDEDDETIDVTLIPQAGAVVVPAEKNHLHTILDDDDPPTLSFVTATSSSDENTATAMVALTLSALSEREIKVDYAAAAGGSASPADFTITAATLTIPPGTLTSAVPVAIENDALDENPETVAIALSNPVNVTLAAPLAHTLTIADDDDPPTIEFNVVSSSVNENTANHTINVVLSAPSGRDVTFTVTRAANSAAGANDLTIPAAAITIPPGTTNMNFNVTITNDTLDEDDETASLGLANLVNATLGTKATHVVTVQDNDDAPSVRFDPTTPSRSVNEGDGGGTTSNDYRVLLSAASGRTVTVTIVRGGGANPGPGAQQDYSIPAGEYPTLTFAPGETSKTIHIIVEHDNQNEFDETVTLRLSAATNATVGADDERIHTINDDD